MTCRKSDTAARVDAIARAFITRNTSIDLLDTALARAIRARLAELAREGRQ